MGDGFPEMCFFDSFVGFWLVFFCEVKMIKDGIYATV